KSYAWQQLAVNRPEVLATRARPITVCAMAHGRRRQAGHVWAPGALASGSPRVAANLALPRAILEQEFVVAPARVMARRALLALEGEALSMHEGNDICGEGAIAVGFEVGGFHLHVAKLAEDRGRTLEDGQFRALGVEDQGVQSGKLDISCLQRRGQGRGPHRNGVDVGDFW